MSQAKPIQATQCNNRLIADIDNFGFQQRNVVNECAIQTGLISLGSGVKGTILKVIPKLPFPLIKRNRQRAMPAADEATPIMNEPIDPNGVRIGCTNDITAKPKGIRRASVTQIRQLTE